MENSYSLPDYLEPYAAAARKRKKNKKNRKLLLSTYYPNSDGFDTSTPAKSSELSPEERRRTLQRLKRSELSWAPFDPEFLNYVFALLVFAIRLVLF